jgi:hypothetical protein
LFLSGHQGHGSADLSRAHQGYFCSCHFYPSFALTTLM